MSADSIGVDDGAATSTKRPNDLLIPPRILTAAGLSNGDILRLTSHGDGSIQIVRSDNDEGETLQGRVVVVDEAIASATSVAAGDTLQFEVVEDNTIRARRVEGTSLASFTNPPRDEDGPIPPSWLIQAFTGQPDLDGFLQSGPRTVDILAEIVERSGGDIASYEKILDFGCGCGRVLRCLGRHTNAVRVGTDLHDRAIDWNSANYENSEFFYGTELPPTPRSNDEFDLIYAVSVLTHLDEAHQDAWLAEWQRIVKPGGLVIATYRAEDFLKKYMGPRGKAIREQLDESNGMIFKTTDGWEGVFEKFYGGAYHRKRYILDHWSEYFEILELIDAGDFGNNQNAAVMRKRSGPRRAVPSTTPTAAAMPPTPPAPPTPAATPAPVAAPPAATGASSGALSADEQKTVGDHWNKQTRKRRPLRWQGNHHIVRAINKLVYNTDSTTWGEGLTKRVLAEYADRLPLAHGVSVACGNGRKEMDLITAGLVERFTFYEIAEQRAEDGMGFARRRGIEDRVEFRIEDVFAGPTEDIAETFDLVVWYNALHHMIDTPAAIKWSRDVLRPGGVFLMDDFIGPDRFQYAPEVIEAAHAFRTSLPDDVYVWDGPYQPRRPRRALVPADAVIAQDPSEAADSSRILEGLDTYFPDRTHFDVSSGALIFGLADIASRLLEPQYEPFIELVLRVDQMLIKDGHHAFAACYAEKM